MHSIVPRKSSRYVKKRHTDFFARSLSSMKLFETSSIDIRSSSNLAALPISSEKERNDKSKTTNFVRSSNLSLIPREVDLPRSSEFSTKYSSSMNRSHDGAMNLLRSTLSSPTVYHTLVYDPLNLCLGLSRVNNYQACSKVFFSSNTRRRRSGAKIPTPQSDAKDSLLPFGSIDPAALARSAIDLTWSMTKALVNFLVRLPGNTLFYLMNSKERQERIAQIKEAAKKEFDHYRMGSKLLIADVRTARSLFAKTLQGSTLTRRERKQLLRTVTDLFRLVPFSMFLIIPFMEFALPFALRIFPNMLPSTFQDSLKSEENMKRELKSRIAMAQFFQETLEDLAKEQKRIAAKRNSEDSDDKLASKEVESAASMLEFLDRARKGEMMPPDVIVQYATYFQDDLTLDNMPRMQLLNMCKYMGIPPYGSDYFLRFQLRHKIKTLKEDDQRILWEGIDSLTKMELREACQDRGMRSTGLSKEAYKRSLQQWLDLSVNMNVPHSLLIMSRTFFLQEESSAPTASDEAKSVAGLADAISGLDKGVLNEVILEVATSEEKKSDPDVRKIKLEVLSHQNEKIREEQAERESAAKKKESADKAESQKAEKPHQEDKADSIGEKDPTKTSTAKLEEKDIAAEKFFSDDKDGNAEEIILSEEKKTKESSEEDKSDRRLSAEEMEAIEEVVSADPVSKEREELKRIKSAMQDSEEKDEGGIETESEVVSSEESSSDTEKDAFLEADEFVKSEVQAAEQQAIEEAEKATIFSSGSGTLENMKGDREEDGFVELDEEEDKVDEEEPKEDAVVARLKKSVESMVDKIELQLSDVEVKIGDKLHILDKDNDGILTREEMIEGLQQVFKRELSLEEATEIASQMDENDDGVLTVQELIKWIETNKLVQLESEGRDADMDRIMEKRSQKDENSSDSQEKEDKA